MTKKWLVDHLDPVFGFPGIVRFSWKTSTNLLGTKGSIMEWNDIYNPTNMNQGDFKKVEQMKL